MMAKNSLSRRVVAAVLSIAAFSACSPQSSTAAAPEAASQSNAPAAAPVAAAPTATTLASPARAPLPDFAGLVERFGPSVVNISVVGRERPAAQFPGLSPDDPFYEFFRRFGTPTPRGNRPPSRGEGSGFIVSADGYILTNAHVVDEAQEVTVRMTDRREYNAKVVGLDKRTDVAVLKIDARNLPTVRIGNPAALRPGEWVVAIGSPFGFDNSVTAGIVSAIARALPNEDSNYVPFIQTDVAVNPGNSGGPLFNLNGEVVGINSQIYSATGGYMGLSFAIPIDIASNVKEQLIASGRVRRGRIGVSIQEVNAQFAESFGLDRPRGALVGSVEQGGPADKAGVKPGDIILQANERAIERSSDLPSVIAAIKPGAEATLELWRDRRTQRVTVRVAELQERSPLVPARGERDSEREGALGLAVRPLDEEERTEVKTDGLLVEGVTGPAAAAGVQRGDIIVGVNRAPVRTLKELQDAVGKAGKTVALRIQRDGQQIFVPVRIG